LMDRYTNIQSSRAAEWLRGRRRRSRPGPYPYFARGCMPVAPRASAKAESWGL